MGRHDEAMIGCRPSSDRSQCRRKRPLEIPEAYADHSLVYARLLVQCSCPVASGHAEPGLCSESQVSASLPPSTR